MAVKNDSTRIDSESHELRPVLIGTAGHIDHGKTTLVHRLTGINTDRLPEEKARGISIDLGFAHFDCGEYRFGIVDVPGHERFIRQMVAGAANIDIALLVVAADDGVMPQTREHLDILQLLGVVSAVVAVTRTDLVDADMLALVIDDIRDLLKPTPLADAPIVAVSSVTGAGMDDLRVALCQVASTTAGAGSRTSPAFFRMPIDRVFTRPGHGTVVTGSVLSGSVSAGDDIELLPTGVPVRVRSVQHHGEAVSAVSAHRRAAINLAGVAMDDVHRGDELATAGVLQPTRRLLARIQVLPQVRRPFRHRQLLTLHAGTTSVLARLRLPNGEIAPASAGYADIRLQSPIVLTFGQRVILRSSASETVGGGCVLDPLPGARRIRDFSARCTAAEAGPMDALGSLLAHQPYSTGVEFPQRLGLSLQDAQRLVESVGRGERAIIRDPDSGRLIHTRWLDRLGRSLTRLIRNELSRQTTKRLLPRAMIVSQSRDFDGADLVPLALRRLEESGELTVRGDLIGPTALQVSLTKRQREVLDIVLPLVQQQARTPPTHKELSAAATRMTPQEVEQLIRLCHQDGSLIAVSPDLSYTPEGLDELQRDIAALFAARPEVTLAEIRDALRMTRKHVVPLAEYWDKHKFTVRSGDLRKRGPALSCYTAGNDSPTSQPTQAAAD